MEKIRKPLEQQGVISENEAKDMFANIESMVGLSAQIAEELEQILKHWDRHRTLIG